MNVLIKVLIWIPLYLWQSNFKEKQLQHARVRAAYQEKESIVKDYFKLHEIDYRGFNLYLRAFKNSKELEVWVKASGQPKYVLIKTFPFCTSSGTLGPKRKEGDQQIPEGIYHINHFNPDSNFHLSLGINYPNQSDKILSDRTSPGGSIYIHGSCVTIGCIPITDDKIMELYVLAVEARNNGQLKIPVHIFPDRLPTNDSLMDLINEHNASSTTASLWKNLQKLFIEFEANHTLRPIEVDATGVYY